jgi:2-oxoglutarate dehydrogenase complex dehydrogenase (E1) component-like enzyme
MTHETPSESITKLIYTYAERIDTGDFAGAAEVLAYATLTSEGSDDTISGVDTIRGLYEQSTRRYEDGTPRTKHVMTNVIVEVAEDELSANSRSYFTVLQAVPGSLALQPVIAGRYHNRYAQVDGQWRFTGLHFIIDLVGDLSHHLLGDLQP